VQAPVAGVHLCLHAGELFEQVIDAVSLQGSLVVLAARPERRVQQGPPASSQTLVNLMVFIFFLPDTNARRPGRCAGGGGPGSRCRRSAA
jgi:hypothetical protein